MLARIYKQNEYNIDMYPVLTWMLLVYGNQVTLTRHNHSYQQLNINTHDYVLETLYLKDACYIWFSKKKNLF